MYVCTLISRNFLSNLKRESTVVEIPEIYSHAFVTKISCESNVFTKELISRKKIIRLRENFRFDDRPRVKQFSNRKLGKRLRDY